jgi:hypothetical protein
MVETPHGIGMVGGRLIQRDRPEMIQVAYSIHNIRPEFRDWILPRMHFKGGPCVFYAYYPDELKPVI